MELTEALRHALDGEAVLFLGAGFSLGATNKANANFPLATGLSEHLMNCLGEKEQVRLDTAARLYIKRLGEVSLLAELNRYLGVARVASQHEQFARVPWKRVYTTNYDEVFETACRQQGIRVTPVISTETLGPLSVEALECVHLNGFLPLAKPGTLDQTLVLTRRSELESTLVRSPWYSLFADDLRTARAILFLGYSAGDFTIGQLLVGRSISRKAVFVVKADPGLELSSSIEEFGTMFAVGIEGAASILQDICAVHIPRRAPLNFNSFRKQTVTPPRAREPTISEVSNVFLRGEIDLELLARGINDPSQRYLVSRGAAREIVDRLRNGAPVVAVLSRLANGKTTLIEEACLKLADHFDVLQFDRTTASLDAEVAALRVSDRPTLVVFDDYSRHLATIRSLCLGGSVNLALLLGCRTPTHLTHQADLTQAVGGREIAEVSVDALSDNELGQLTDILASNALLGELAGSNSAAQARTLREDGRGELGSILLWLLETPNIQRRLQDVYSALPRHGDVQRVVIASLLMTHVQVVPDVWDLAGLIGAKAINQALFSDNEEVSHLVRLGSSRLQAPSTLFAAAALRMLWQVDRLSLLDLVEEVITNAWSCSQRVATFHRIARELMRYSVVRVIVPRSDRNEHVLEYYNRIRNLDACANNDLFWLQFTIAAIEAGLFEQARRNIETSYEIARRRTGYRTDQHDNVLASFLLAREAAEPDASRAFQSFVQARRIIGAQMASGDHKYYPFRVARRYRAFWRAIAKGWPEPNRGLFLQACREVLERLDRASLGIATMDDLATCRQEILMVLAEA